MKKFLLSMLMLIAIAFTSNAQMANGCSKFLGNITTGGYEQCDYTCNGKTWTFSDYWNQVTCENGCKWGSVHQGWGKFNWTNADRTYNYCKQKGILFKFHALVWGSQYPSWIGSLSVSDTKKAIIEWFDEVQKHYPDLQIIDVVNEAIYAGSDYHSPYKNTKIIQALTELANERLGTNYQANTNGYSNNNDYQWIAEAFRMARDRWPDAILIYNDYNTFQWQKSQFIDLVNGLKACKAPIDAAGNQSHDLNDMSGTQFKNALYEIYQKTGLPQYITEYDIAHSNDATFETRYKEQFPVMWEADFVPGVTLWGWVYGQTWTTDGNSGLIKNCSARSAFTWLQSYMQSSTAKNVKAPDMSKGTITASLSINKENVEVGQSVTITTEAKSKEGMVSVVTYINGKQVGNQSVTYTPTESGKYEVKVVVKDSKSEKELTGSFSACDARKKFSDNTIPGLIEAEDFDYGCSGVSYSESDGVDEGESGYRSDETGVDIVKGGDNYAVGYTAKGEWLKYEVNVEETGDYVVEAHVASGSDGSSFDVAIGSSKVSFKVPNGGDWDTYTTISDEISLIKGVQDMVLTITGPYVNIDWIRLTRKGTVGFEDIENEDLLWDIYSLDGILLGGNYKLRQIEGIGLPVGLYIIKCNTRTSLYYNGSKTRRH